MESSVGLAKPLFAISITPTVIGVEKAFELAKIADGSAIDLVTIQDHPYADYFMDTWTFVTALAMRTERVKLKLRIARTSGQTWQTRRGC